MTGRVGDDDKWTDKCLLVKFCQGSLLGGHYQHVHEKLLEVHTKFKEKDFLSQPCNMHLEKKKKKKNSFLAPPAPLRSDSSYGNIYRVTAKAWPLP